MKEAAGKILFATVIFLLSSTAFAAAKKCSKSVAGQVGSTSTAWRTANTHLTSDAEFVKTTAAREKKIKETGKNMELFILEDKDVPEMEFFAEAGTKVKVVRHWRENKIPYIEVGGLGSSGLLRGSLLLPVSGHVGTENARKWAKTDTYQLFLEPKQGKAWSLVGKAKSLDLITLHEIELPLKKGEPMKLTYHRSGSGGPAGFPEGRIIEILWDGT